MCLCIELGTMNGCRINIFEIPAKFFCGNSFNMVWSVTDKRFVNTKQILKKWLFDQN